MNDDFQVVENQLARQRLFSVHPNHKQPLNRWVEDIRDGIHSFDDQLARTPSLKGKLARADVRRREELVEFGRDPESWMPYEEALRKLSNDLGPGYPKRIMLDSGAFTDWGQGRRSNVDDVIRAYHDFLERADGLFTEILLINLDWIPGEKAKAGQERKQATRSETTEAIWQSDANFAKLKSEFDHVVLPVFHQEKFESLGRLHEVVEMSEGYLCLSPNNDDIENNRVDWAVFHCLATEGARCHGLATTGNNMMQLAGLYSGDSTSWRTHGGNGDIDVRWNAPRVVDQLGAPPLTPRYRFRI